MNHRPAFRLTVIALLSALAGKGVEWLWLTQHFYYNAWRAATLLIVLAPAIGLIGAGRHRSGHAYAAAGLFAAIAVGIGLGVAFTTLDADLLPRDAFIEGFAIGALMSIAGVAAGGGLLYGSQALRRRGLHL